MWPAVLIDDFARSGGELAIARNIDAKDSGSARFERRLHR